jgi:hypothetical protein
LKILAFSRFRFPEMLLALLQGFLRIAGFWMMGVGTGNTWLLVLRSHPAGDVLRAIGAALGWLASL